MKSYLALLLLAASSLFGQTRTMVSVEGNQTITGNKTFSGVFTAKQLANCQWVDSANAAGWAGADFGAWATAAAVVAGANGTVCVANGNYTYTTDVVITTPLALICPGQRCLLTYNGSGKAMKLGPDGLTIGTANPEPYTIYGFEFNGGGASWTSGIYHNRFVIKSFIVNTRFINSGNSSAYNIFYQAENWYSNLNNVYMWGTSGGPCYNGIMVNDVATDNTTYDSGDSFVRFLGVHVQNLASGCSTTTGINVNSFQPDFNQVDVLGGFHYLVRLRKGANKASFSDFYGEEVNTEAGACGILYGDLSTDPAAAVSNFLDSVMAGPTFYINLHNTDFTTTAHAFCPATATAGAQNWNLSNVTAANLTAGQPIVVQNNIVSQGGNVSNYARVSTSASTFATGSAIGSLHTAGGNITGWTGTDEQIVLQKGMGLTQQDANGVSRFSMSNTVGGTTSMSNNGNVFMTVDSSGTPTVGTSTTSFNTLQGHNQVVGDYQFLEQTAPSGVASRELCYGDSTAHALKCSYNNVGFFNVTQTIGTGNVTTAGTAVTNGTCQAQTNITVTGTAVTDGVTANIGAALPATWQTGIVLSAHPTATNTVTVYLCNPTAGSITPAATVVNVRVTR